MNLEPADLTQNSFLTTMDSVCYDDKTIGRFATSHNKSMILFINNGASCILKIGETESVAYRE